MKSIALLIVLIVIGLAVPKLVLSKHKLWLVM